MKEFFVVWNPKHGQPAFQHPTIGDACAEAERLARRHPGQSFHVLGLMGTACQPEQPSIYAATPLGLAAEVPF